jgi:hypothetical protein
MRIIRNKNNREQVDGRARPPLLRKGFRWGLIGVLGFFLFKGLAWLALPALLAYLTAG